MPACRPAEVVSNNAHLKKMNLNNDLAEWSAWEFLVRSEDLCTACIVLRRCFLPPVPRGGRPGRRPATRNGKHRPGQLPARPGCRLRHQACMVPVRVRTYTVHDIVKLASTEAEVARFQRLQRLEQSQVGAEPEPTVQDDGSLKCRDRLFSTYK